MTNGKAPSRPETSPLHEPPHPGYHRTGGRDSIKAKQETASTDFDGEGERASSNSGGSVSGGGDRIAVRANADSQDSRNTPESFLQNEAEASAAVPTSPSAPSDVRPGAVAVPGPEADSYGTTQLSRYVSTSNGSDRNAAASGDDDPDDVIAAYAVEAGVGDHPPMVEAYAVDENYHNEQGRTVPTTSTTIATVVERKTVCWIERTRFALLVSVLGILVLVGVVLGITLSDNDGGGGGNENALGTKTLSDDDNNGDNSTVTIPPTHATLGRPNCPPAEPIQTGSTPLQFCDDADTTAACWVQVGSDLESQFDPDENFGDRLTLASSGDRFLVSAPTTDTCKGEEAGVVRVYDVVVDGDGDGGGGGWGPTIAQVGGDFLGSQEGDKLIGVLSRGGNRVAIGAKYWNSPESDSSEGQVRVYELKKIRDGGESWELVGSPIDGKTWKERTGRSVALSPSGDIVAAGAPNYDSHRGVVRVYKEVKVNATFSRWEQMGSNINGTDIFGRFGWAMSFSDDGETLVVGQKLKESVRVFRYAPASADWVQLGNVVRGLNGGNFGRMVSIASDGNTISVGAYLGDGEYGEDSGHVQIFAYDEAKKVWDQVGDHIVGDAARTWLSSNSLSADGRRIAVSTGVADEERGYARVYDLIGDAWEQVGGTIRGQKVGEKSGVDISLAPDGQRLLVGGKGVVRLFKLRSIFKDA